MSVRIVWLLFGDEGQQISPDPKRHDGHILAAIPLDDERFFRFGNQAAGQAEGIPQMADPDDAVAFVGRREVKIRARAEFRNGNRLKIGIHGNLNGGKQILYN